MKPSEGQLERLLRLERLLTASPAADPRRAHTGAAETVLGLAATQRIKAMTAELRGNHDSAIDLSERLTMRLLLTEYLAVVAHLRAVARIVEEDLAKAAPEIRECGRLYNRHFGTLS